MPRLRIYPYNMGSHSVRSLQSWFEEHRLSRPLAVYPGGRFRGGPQYRVVNWGSSAIPEWYNNVAPEHLLNHPAQVKKATNKRLFMEACRAYDTETQGPNTVPLYSTTHDGARELFTTENQMVVARTTLQGHSGEGIHIVRGVAELDNLLNNGVRPKLYTLHARHRDEYRIHLFRGEVLDAQQKRRRTDFEGEVNTHVRSHANGWVFCRENLAVPDTVLAAARRAMAACALDFGAVDVVHRVGDNIAYALEVNTAPGLEGTTLENYAQRIHAWFRELR